MDGAGSARIANDGLAVTPDDGPRWRAMLNRDLAGRAAVELKLVARAADRRRRVDPDFAIVGAQKAGTSSLFGYLASHPGVQAPLAKEIHYFSLSYGRGMAWYRRNFPVAGQGAGLTGEATPFYLVYPRALERMATELPDVKVITILRDPVARLISHYRHSVRLGYETLSLTDALAAEEDRLAEDWERLEHDALHPARNLQRFSYVHRSLYDPQVERVQRLFPGRCLFLRLEDLHDTEALRPLTDFLGLEFLPQLPVVTQNANPGEPPRSRETVPPDVVDRLRADADATTERLGWEPWAR